MYCIHKHFLSGSYSQGKHEYRCRWFFLLIKKTLIKTACLTKVAELNKGKQKMNLE